MIKPTIICWILLAFGDLIYLVLLMAQLTIILKPDSQKTRDILIGKGKQWRDKTHFKSAYAFAWADWLVIMPLLALCNIGFISGVLWGYIIMLVVGILSIYFSIVFWFMDKEYTYPSYGPLAYYTYFWGFYLYWGFGAIIYSTLKLNIV